MDVLQTLLAVAAIAISLVSAWYSRKSANSTRDQAQAAKVALEIEQARRAEEVEALITQADEMSRAMPRINLEKATGLSTLLTVHNQGPAEATCVALNFVDIDTPGSPPMTQYWNELSKVIEAGQTSSVTAGIFAETAQKFRVKLYWKDGAGDQSKEYVLNQMDAK